MRAVLELPDPFSRAEPLHVTGSALVVHPPSERVLLHWHAKLGRWLQLGGHGDPGERDPAAVALREAAEETGLGDLRHWPEAALPTLLQVVVVPVDVAGQPFHEHADFRYLLATDRPESARPEPGSALRWLSLPEARSLVTMPDGGLRVALDRVGEALEEAG